MFVKIVILESDILLTLSNRHMPNISGITVIQEPLNQVNIHSSHNEQINIIQNFTGVMNLLKCPPNQPGVCMLAILDWVRIFPYPILEETSKKKRGMWNKKESKTHCLASPITLYYYAPCSCRSVYIINIWCTLYNFSSIF